MRPELLYRYFADIEALSGIGKRTRAAFERAAGGRYVDLLLHLPSGLIDRRYRPKVDEAADGSIVEWKDDLVQGERALQKLPYSRIPYPLDTAAAAGSPAGA